MPVRGIIPRARSLVEVVGDPIAVDEDLDPVVENAWGLIGLLGVDELVSYSEREEQ